MKAIQMTQSGGPEVLKLVEIEEPIVGENEVLVNLYYAGVNPFETYIREGGYAFYTPDFPYTPGFDGAGKVEQVGSRVKDFSIGDRVFVASTLSKTSGTYAEKVVCEEDALRKIPDDLSYAEAAAIGVPATTAYKALFQRGRLKKGEKVLIHGASGGVGTLAVQMAKQIGVYVIGTAGSQEGLEAVQKNGADLVLNHSEEAYLEQVKDVDLIIEMLANKNLTNDLQIINKYGRIVVVGNRGTLEFDPRQIMAKEIDLLGLAIWNYHPEDYQTSLDEIAKMLNQQTLKPAIGRIYPLEKAAQAQYDIIHSKAKGKILLEIQKE